MAVVVIPFLLSFSSVMQAGTVLKSLAKLPTISSSSSDHRQNGNNTATGRNGLGLSNDTLGVRAEGGWNKTRGSGGIGLILRHKTLATNTSSKEDYAVPPSPPLILGLNVGTLPRGMGTMLLQIMAVAQLADQCGATAAFAPPGKLTFDADPRDLTTLRHVDIEREAAGDATVLMSMKGDFKGEAISQCFSRGIDRRVPRAVSENRTSVAMYSRSLVRRVLSVSGTFCEKMRQYGDRSAGGSRMRVRCAGDGDGAVDGADDRRTPLHEAVALPPDTPRPIVAVHSRNGDACPPYTTWRPDCVGTWAEWRRLLRLRGVREGTILLASDSQDVIEDALDDKEYTVLAWEGIDRRKYEPPIIPEDANLTGHEMRLKQWIERREFSSGEKQELLMEFVLDLALVARAEDLFVASFYSSFARIGYALSRSLSYASLDNLFTLQGGYNQVKKPYVHYEREEWRKDYGEREFQMWEQLETIPNQ